MSQNPTRLHEPVTSTSAPPAQQTKRRRRTVAAWAAPIIAGIAIALAPAPHGLPLNTWHYFALFAAVMVGIITEPIPAAALGLVGIVVAAVSGFVHPSTSQSALWALSGFANGTVWLIFAAYIFSLGYSKTGLGKRIALMLIRAMGKRTLGLGYAIALADLALSPFMPSNTARSGGTIFPILRNIPELYGSLPNDETARKIGAYLMYTALAVTCVTSSMFVTALAPNVLAADLALRTIHVTLSWTDWFKGFAPVGFLLLAIVPILLYKIYPPQTREAPEAPRWAAEELRKMGPISDKEITLLALVLLALILWIGGAKYIDATIAAILVVTLMIILRVVTWNDILANTQAWNVLVWFATLVTLAGGLAETKFVDWIAQSLAPILSHRGVIMAAVLLVAAFFLLHYLFASITAHVSALFQVFLVVAITIPGMSRLAWALLLSYPLGLMGILTPYGTGPSPIYYGCGYIKGKDFWILGLVLGLLFFAVYVLIELPWLAFLKI
ncbi:MAG: anion permease [Acidobacteria bacterium]|nr:MAG: anion permease [Acidobacteriota bacterium]